MSAAQLRGFVDASRFTRVKRLVFDRNKLEQAGVDALDDFARENPLVELSLTRCQLGYPGINVLVETAVLTLTVSAVLVCRVHFRTMLHQIRGDQRVIRHVEPRGAGRPIASMG